WLAPAAVSEPSKPSPEPPEWSGSGSSRKAGTDSRSTLTRDAALICTGTAGAAVVARMVVIPASLPFRHKRRGYNGVGATDGPTGVRRSGTAGQAPPTAFRPRNQRSS